MKKIIGEYSTEIELTDKEAKTICKLGELSNCCAFLVMASSGFQCIRMSYPTNTSIFTRLEEGTMNAKGKGGWEGCPWKDKLDDFNWK